MICPLCNALGSVQISCPACGSVAEDEGRWNDWTGPYSPYEPYLLQSVAHQAEMEPTVCAHAIHCASCQQLSRVAIALWHI